MVVRCAVGVIVWTGPWTRITLRFKLLDNGLSFALGVDLYEGIGFQRPALYISIPNGHVKHWSDVCGGGFVGYRL